MLRRILIILLALDILCNSLIGGEPYQTISRRIGLDIQAGGWASHVPWPTLLLNHFKASVHEALV